MSHNSKNVLVTGANGFIGSHLTEMLFESGYCVKALSHYNSANHWGWLEDVHCKNEIEIVTGDVRDPFFCGKITKDVDTVFHLAALIAIPYSYAAPASYIETNVTGTLNMCHAALANKCRRFIHMSTSEVYGTAQYVPIDEQHPKQPQSPYSASKIGADALALSLHYTFNLPVTIARPFNTYGPRQSARAIIPTIITQVASGKRRIHLGDLRPTRDFNFVKDTCKALILLSEKETTIGREINIATNHEITVADLVKTILKIMDADVEITSQEERCRPEHSEVFRLWGDNRLISELTGYSPQYSLYAGLKETVEWIKNPENLKRYKTDIYNV